MQRIGYYPGSFDPPTNGHLDIINRAARLVDCLVIGIGTHHGKTPMLKLEQRISLLEAEAGPLVREAGAKFVITTFDGLVVDAAREAGAVMLIRGLRNVADFDYEAQMARMNAAMAPDVETVFLFASPHTASIASSLVKQIAGMGGDISPFVPGSVVKAIAKKARS